MQKHQVKALLMGGQACVWYGAAEFSRDTDLAVLAEAENIARLRQALDELEAKCIAVPAFATEYLERGHAIHFRCQHPEAKGLRVDIMSVMRGVDSFPALWARRETLQDDAGTNYELLALPDLVLAKKTQREKDWPMIRRLMEAHYLQHRAVPKALQVEFWFRELRTPEFLIQLAARFPEQCRQMLAQRNVLQSAVAGDEPGIVQKLKDEVAEESARDQLYWTPLKRELEEFRRCITNTSSEGI